MELFGLICAAGGLGVLFGTLLGLYAVREGVKIGAEVVMQGLKTRVPGGETEPEPGVPELKMPDDPDDVPRRPRLKQFDTA